jgi:hypothetical protein
MSFSSRSGLALKGEPQPSTQAYRLLTLCRLLERGLAGDRFGSSDRCGVLDPSPTGLDIRV